MRRSFSRTFCVISVIVLCAFVLTALVDVKEDPLIFKPWPGSQEVAAVENTGLDSGNVSGLTLQSNEAAYSMWAVKNNPSILFHLTNEGGSWKPSNDEEFGQALTYPDGGGSPDAEAVQFVERTTGDAVYVAIERDNHNPDFSDLSVLRFDPNQGGDVLVADKHWDLNEDFSMEIPPNAGFEGLAFVPDDILLSERFFDESANEAYNPSKYDSDAGGVFFLGLEKTGTIFGYVLNRDGSSERIATIDSGLPMISELEFDVDGKQLWVICDHACGGRANVLHLKSTLWMRTHMPIQASFLMPDELPDTNIEGFAVTGQENCQDGQRRVFWADDDALDDIILWEGSLACEK